MLSKGAFNALLKTLEEPPEHVKFIFATTEIRKVPVTVLSRCQRFDLRRVDVPVLTQHFEKILAAEGSRAEPDALALIARAAEGSVRDGLSILDQAIAMGSGAVTADTVRAMLGLADRGRVFDLLDNLLAGRPAEALAVLAGLHRDGAEPLAILADLAEAVHITTRIKVAGANAGGDGLSAQEVRRAGALAAGLSQAILARAWQMLVRGIEEASRAPDAFAAAEMVLIRLAYTADLPTPDDLIRRIGGAAGQREAVAPVSQTSTAPAPRPLMNTRATLPAAAAPPPVAKKSPADGPAPWEDAPPPFEQMQELDAEPPEGEIEYADETIPARATPQRADPRTFEDVVRLAGLNREAKLKIHLEEHVSLVKFEPAGSIELHLLAGAPKELANELREKLNRWTGRRWMIAVGKSAGAAPLGQAERARVAAEIEELRRHPAVAELLREFPDAKITGVRPLAPPAEDETATG